MNLADLQAECGRLLGDANNTRWTTAVLTSRANLAQTEIQGYTNAVKTLETVTPVQSTRTISLNANTMDLVRASKTLSDGTSVRPFVGISREELDFLYPDWQQWQDGEPLYWFWDATNRQVNVVPKPDGPNSITNGLSFWESRKPADLVASSDVPFDSNNQMIPYHMSIVHWVVSHCFMDDGTPEALGKAKFHKSGVMMRPGEYEKELGRIMSEFDTPEIVPSHVMFKPQGGRIGSWEYPSKSNPLPW